LEPLTWTLTNTLNHNYNTSIEGPRLINELNKTSVMDGLARFNANLTTLVARNNSSGFDLMLAILMVFGVGVLLIQTSSVEISGLWDDLYSRLRKLLKQLL